MKLTIGCNSTVYIPKTKVSESYHIMKVNKKGKSLKTNLSLSRFISNSPDTAVFRFTAKCHVSVAA